MKILLILPAATHLRVQPGQKVPHRAMLRFSVLPLLAVAALTGPEHEVTLCDENVQPLDLDAPVDAVGITFMTALAPRAYEIAAHFRARGIPVIGGGYHPTLCPDDAAQHLDAVVVGEAEGIWPQVLRDIEQGRLQKIYRAAIPADPATIPVPRRQLLEHVRQHYVTIHAVQAGRGCPHACKYCSIAAFFHSSYRARPVAQVRDELAQIPRHFMFVDDNIIADRDYAAALFRALIPLKKRWVAQCAIDIADDPELLDLAYRAGCRGLFIGIETISESALADLNKSFNAPHSYARRVAVIRLRGIAVQAGIIVGLDHDRPEVFERTLRYLEALHIDALQLNILTPLPGTPMHEQFRLAERITDHDWSHYDFRHVVIRPAGMTAQQLQNGADWLYAQYYRLDRVLWRAARTFLEVGPLAGLTLLRLNLTYRYDNLREGIRGKNPARTLTEGERRALKMVPA
ncbi:MAG: radical SAM protein [Phycisphaerae bacterium]